MKVGELKELLKDFDDESEVGVSLDIMDEFDEEVTFQTIDWGKNKKLILIGQETEISSAFLEGVLRRACYNNDYERELIEKFMDGRGWEDERFMD